MKRSQLTLALCALLCSTAIQAQTADKLSREFKDPPTEARPRTWWHWLNGNITIDGIDKDLAWMKRIGLGGVQNFDVSMGMPQIVKHRLAYMSPEWKQAFSHAVSVADKLHLEFAIASSPGWSETGGPWVKPADGMKKLVWSETLVTGGAPFVGKLATPPRVTGPYGTAPYVDYTPGALGNGGGAVPVAHGDVAVLAYPIDSPAESVSPIATTQDGKVLDDAKLSDEREDSIVDEPLATAKGAVTSVTLTYPNPISVQSATFFMPGVTSPFAPPPYAPIIEADVGGVWTKVADAPIASVPTTVAFAPVTAARFRLTLVPFIPSAPSDAAPPAPGAEGFDLAKKRDSTKVDLATFTVSGTPRVDRVEAKAGYVMVPDYYALDKPLPKVAAVDPSRVIDLTDRMQADGTLDWTPPPGHWRVLRLGWSLLGTTNHPAVPEATGLEVDKYDGAAVRRYLDDYLKTYAAAMKPGDKGIDALLTDSIEAGEANWTPELIAKFKSLRGYDPTPWLPVISGAVIGSRAKSDQFLYDFRQTLADLMVSEHYGTVAKVAHENGLKLYGEALEDKRPQLGNDIAMRKFTDVPMAAMWAFPVGGSPRATLLGDDMGAASVANLYGRKYVAAESLTSMLAPWAFAPNDLRHIIDLEFALGINRPVIHTSAHSPSDTKLPGLSLAIVGQYFNRHDTWSAMARPWVDYIARTGYLLQQGRHAADYLYFFGEEAPLTQLYADGRLKTLPTGRGFDFVDSGALSDAISVADGQLISKGGVRYAALYLGGTSRRMTLPTLKRIAALAEAGATIIGKPPVGSPSLADDKPAFDTLVKRLWSGHGTTTVGKGRVIDSDDVEATLNANGLAADFATDDTENAAPLLMQHRLLGDGGHLYFLVNRDTKPRTVEASFRVTGLAPELWDARTGEHRPLSYRIENGRTRVPLKIGAERSLFVVFRKAATVDRRTVAAPKWVKLHTLISPWTVAFQPGRGAPPSAEFKKLQPLNDSKVPGIKYFSGTATYITRFSTPHSWVKGKSLWIDLGQVGDVASVSVNGKQAGIVWQAPYRVDIGALVKPGENQLSVKVANLWVNRLIGDKQPGATKISWTAAPTYKPDAPLRPSGLMGPVELMGRQ